MIDTRFNRRNALKVMAGGALALSAPAIISARAQSLDAVSYQTGWLPQAEQGGFYQAAATGIYAEYGLEVDIRKSGPQMDITTPFLAGRTDFIESSGFAVLNFVAEDLPGVAVASMFQKDPRVLLSHPGQGNDTLPDLKDKPILVATGGRQTYWVWLKAKYDFAEEQARPYTFNMAPFLADTSLTMQGLLTSEPFDLREAGVDPVIHLLADYGFNNYSSIVLTSPTMISDRPDVVQRFVDASIKGWDSYMNGDPTPANDIIKAENPDMSDEKIAYTIKAMKDYDLVSSGDAASLGIGAMTAERWQAFYDELVAAEAQPAGLDISKGYTLDFVNKGVAL